MLVVNRDARDFIHEIHSIAQHFSEHGVISVKIVVVREVDVELRASAIRVVGPRHSKVAQVISQRAVNFERDGLGRSVLSPCIAVPPTINSSRIPGLNYESRNYSVPREIRVESRVSKFHEIGDRYWCLSWKELNDERSVCRGQFRINRSRHPRSYRVFQTSARTDYCNSIRSVVCG